jgi:hypothetical protein
MRAPIFWGSAVFLAVLSVGVGCAYAVNTSVSVSATGNTRLSAVSAEQEKAIVTIETHTLDIGKPSDPVPNKPETNCTYSRYPCSLVDRIDFSVDGKAVFTARSVFADISDINSASLSVVGQVFILSLKCGDASESYEATIKFDDGQVLERTITLPGTGYVMQETKYFTMPSMN